MMRTSEDIETEEPVKVTNIDHSEPSLMLPDPASDNPGAVSTNPVRVLLFSPDMM